MPFASAEDAWLWTAQALLARREGARAASPLGQVVRPCEPDDVVTCLDRLYRAGQITLAHARVLRLWGERGSPPDPHRTQEASEARLWREALDQLDLPLRAKRIVGEQEHRS